MRWTQQDLDNFVRRSQTSMPGSVIPIPPGCSPSLLAAAIAPRVKRPKYGNVTVTDATGAKHDSRKEYRRWCELELRAKAGEITALRRQVPYALVVNGILVCQYIADAVYQEGAATICEDCKSPQTRNLAAYSIKRKLMQAIHGIQINEM